MTVLAIPNAISSAIDSLSHHGHKKGVHAGANSLTSTSSADEQDGSTQGLFGSLLDTAEQMVGIQTPTATSAAGAASSTASTASKLSPAAMISAARSALQKA
jgi:hypothetical protein